MTNEELIQKMNESLIDLGVIVEQHGEVLGFKKDDQLLNISVKIMFLDDPDVNAFEVVPEMIKDLLERKL